MNKQLDYEDERADFEERWHSINQNRSPIIFLLSGLQDSRNIGSLFRLADAANIEKILFYNCGVEPQDKRIHKTARSTQKYVPAEKIHDIPSIIALKEKYQLIALEVTSQSIPYTALEVHRPICLIIGAEVSGVVKEILDISDFTVHIPMNGINTSMNVAVATGIVTYHFLNRF